ncbi:hypothetical protein TELCIR_21574, partial [Teladorsagia circumcincta]
MSLTAYATAFAYILYILWAVLSLLAECAKKNVPSAATEFESSSTSRETSASASKRRRRTPRRPQPPAQKSPVVEESAESKGTPKKKVEPPVEAKEEPPAKAPNGKPKAEAAPKKDDGKSVIRSLGKEVGEGAMTAPEGVTDFIDGGAGNKPVSMVL